MTKERQNNDKVLELLTTLDSWFKNIDKVVISLSGGVDSSLVAFAARKNLGKSNIVAIMSVSASIKTKEINDARNFCKEFDIDLHEITSGEMDDPNYIKNAPDRCYICKVSLYNTMQKTIHHQYPDYIIINGHNFSDFADYRPGQKAGEEYCVRSPLAECRFNKEDIRMLAHYYKLPNWNKPSSPCLSSRFPYGESITREKLKMVEKAEDLLNEYNFNDVRVRYINNTARIEVPFAEITKLNELFSEIEPVILSFGFDRCEVDQEGLISGKLNRVITQS